MARPPKIGLSYYNVDTDRYQDIRIKKLIHSFSTSGIAVYDYILNEIYRVKGCFLPWDESTVFDVANSFGLKENTVSEIVSYCCYVGLFNKELLSSERLLTSRSIQLRFAETCKSCKRSNWFIPDKINLTKEETKLTKEETKFITPVSTQSIEEKSKVNYLIRIGDKEMYQKPPSKVLLENYPARFESMMMSRLVGVNKARLLLEFDLAYPFYDFKDLNHFFNSFAKVAKEMKSQVSQPERPIGKKVL